jgi:hypothetical protein
MNRAIKIISVLSVAVIIIFVVVFFLNLPKKTISIQNEDSIADIAKIQETAPEDIESSQVAQEAPESIAEPKNASKEMPKPNVEVDAPLKAAIPESTSGKVIQHNVSFGFQKSSNRSIKAVIIHTSYNALGGDPFEYAKVLKEWKDYGVAPHYAIARDGAIYQLVDDQNIAWHAGSSKLPDGTTDVNGTSIGIEIVNDQSSKFSNEQYVSLNSLIASLKKKYSIKYVLGHADIAPGRKTDPWGIEWNKIQK